MTARTARAVARLRRELASAAALEAAPYTLDAARVMLRDLATASAEMVEALDPAGTIPAAVPVGDRLPWVLRQAAADVASRPLSSQPEVLDALAEAITPGGGWPTARGGADSALLNRAVTTIAGTAGVHVAAPPMLADAVDEWGRHTYPADVVAVLRTAALHAEAATR